MSRRTPHGTLRPLMRSTDGDLSPRHDPSSRASSRSTARCWSSGSTTERSRSIFTARARALGVTATRRSCCRANSVLGWVNAMPSAYAANHEARTGSLSTMSLPIAVPSPFVPVLPLRSLGRPPNGIGDIRPGGWPVHTATTGRRVRSPERRSPAATEENRWIAPMPARSPALARPWDACHSRIHESRRMSGIASGSRSAQGCPPAASEDNRGARLTRRLELPWITRGWG